MIIKSIQLSNFRNYEKLDISFDSETNIIYGDKLEYEVIDKGSNGFLGIGSRDAVIKVKKAEASVEDEVREFLDSVFKAFCSLSIDDIQIKSWDEYK